MLTLFTIPKSFTKPNDIIQRNALRSWTMLDPKCEIFLCGDDPGIKEVAGEFGVKHIPNIDCNEFGTPFLNSAFEKVVKAAQFPVLCYVNADIILMNDLLEAIQRIPFKEFVAIGRRTNVEIGRQWDFDDPNWCKHLIEYAATNGQVGGASWVDCFVFTPNGHIEVMPPFVIGRPRWDNWFIANARMNHTPVIDFTRVCQLIHQKHDYSHVPQGTTINYFNGPEADHNRRLFTSIFGKTKSLGNIWDSTHILTKKFLLPAMGSKYLRQHWYTAIAFHPFLITISNIIDWISVLPPRMKNYLIRIFR